MPYGTGCAPKDGPKSGWRRVVPAAMLDSHAVLWALTGSDEISVFHTLSLGNIGQAPAPGSGVPASAGGAAVETATRTGTATAMSTAADHDRHRIPRHRQAPKRR